MEIQKRKSQIIRSETVDESRRVSIAVSSETPVQRWFQGDIVNEILLHSSDAIDLSFFGNGTAPLLFEHNAERQIGVVESVKLDDDGILRATVLFSASQFASEISKDVQDGIRSNVSVGYTIDEYAFDEKTETLTATRWRPLEVSIVSIPADSSVGVGRSANKKGEKMSEENQNQQTPAPTWTESQVQEVRDNTAAIMELGASYNMSADAAKFVREGKGISEFRGHVLEKMPRGTPLQSRQDVGLNEREVAQFSIFKLARAFAPGATKSDQEAARFEIEATNAAAEIASRNGHTAKGAVMPAELMDNWMKRAVTSTGAASIVTEDYRPGSFIDVLRNKSSVMRAGATMLPGLTGLVDIPKQLTAVAPAWVTAEGANAVTSDPTYGNITMTPRDLAVYVDITRRTRQLSLPSIDNLIRMDIAKSFALGIDKGAIEGTGATGQPRGVLNAVGINKPAAFVGANPTYAEVVALETMVGEDNALDGNLAYILRTNMVGALKTSEKVATTGQFIWEPGNTLNGYTALQSNQLTDGNLYFGDWSQLMIGMWGTLDLQFDYSALAISGGLRIVAFQTVDTAVRYAESFAWNT